MPNNKGNQYCEAFVAEDRLLTIKSNIRPAELGDTDAKCNIWNLGQRDMPINSKGL